MARGTSIQFGIRNITNEFNKTHYEMAGFRDSIPPLETTGRKRQG